MTTNNGGPKQVAANFAFSALLFSLFGWALFELQLFHLHAAVRVHLLISSCGCAVSAIALRRCRVSWAAFADGGGAGARSRPTSHPIGVAASCAVLAAAGGILALCAKHESAAFFALYAGAFSLLPWSGFAFCRRHVFISCALLGAGAACAFLLVRGNQNPLPYLFCAWVLWVIALSELLITWNRVGPATSRPEPIRSVEQQSSQHASGAQLDNLVEHQ